MKSRHVILLIALIFLLDQALKIYVKTHFRIGETYSIAGNWFNIHFIENEGMAWGLKLNNSWGKVILTSFRLAAIIFGIGYIRRLIHLHSNKGFIICVSLIFAGALGNLFDSMFYGLMFDKGMHFDPVVNEFLPYEGLAHFSSKGYTSFFHGNVVDMLYFPLVRTTFPSWVPFVANKPFEFFNMVFNISDASITVGVILLLLFQKKFLKKKDHFDASRSMAYSHSE